MNAALSNYLPLSGGMMTGGIGWDYGGLGGPRIEGPNSPEALEFRSTYAADQNKQVILDFNRIQESDGQRTIAYVEDFGVLSNYLPLSGGVMSNGAQVVFRDEQEN